MELVTELMRSGKRDLCIVDAGATSRAVFGAVTLEPAYGLVMNFRIVDGELGVRRLMSGAGEKEIAGNTGFEVVFESREAIEPPSKEELRVLHEVDPEGVGKVEFK
ncbi:hypothetical protein B6U99_01015 [Candidatus Geothermarchaeota archaeon ex4572_27]|nr:MAG: hypothetical protein B6U99_01015 [Candidatus Geothermarchaeota archaeon ex4572_27]